MRSGSSSSNSSVSNGEAVTRSDLNRLFEEFMRLYHPSYISSASSSFSSRPDDADSSSQSVILQRLGGVQETAQESEFSIAFTEDELAAVSAYLRPDEVRILKELDRADDDSVSWDERSELSSISALNLSRSALYEDAPELKAAKLLFDENRLNEAEQALEATTWQSESQAYQVRYFTLLARVYSGLNKPIQSEEAYQKAFACIRELIENMSHANSSRVSASGSSLELSSSFTQEVATQADLERALAESYLARARHPRGAKH